MYTLFSFDARLPFSLVIDCDPLPALSHCIPCTVGQNNQESRLKYWATRSSVRSFARTAHSFACSGLLASLPLSAAPTRSLARSLRSLSRSWESEFLTSQNDLVLSHSALASASSLSASWLSALFSLHPQNLEVELIPTPWMNFPIEFPSLTSGYFPHLPYRSLTSPMLPR